MPRRTVASATPLRASSNVSFRDSSTLPSSDSSYSTNVSELRRQWKWAAFSQFFFTFAQLLSAPDFSLNDVEDDLARGTALYLPRIMHRLLYTLTQDRKISIDNWQTALRKQYLRRDPESNPLGPEPSAPSRKQSREPSEQPSDQEDWPLDGASNHETPPSQVGSMKHTDGANTPSPPNVNPKSPQPDKTESEAVNDNDLLKTEDDDAVDDDTPQEETKNWLDLPMLVKLDSLHLLTEWQFQNPQRLRNIMKDDGEAGHWRIEPIGYDSKTNAYWLIGPDRLWIQRVPPKPLKRKRKVSKPKGNAKASSSKAALEEASDSDGEVVNAKRTRISRHAPPARASRSQSKQIVTSGRGARAAKLQANRKLDAQAKELAEFQRQAGLTINSEESGSRKSRRIRSTTDIQPNSTTRPVGTRASARLRGSGKDEDEWQQIPDEWLTDTMDPDTKTSGAYRGRGRGKRKAKVELISDEDGSNEERGLDSKASVQHKSKAWLSSDGDSSDLTELSDEEEGVPGEEANVTIAVSMQAASPSTPIGNDAQKDERAIESDRASVPDELPAGFVEWETICVTLFEWDHIADRFEKATHYLEKALYKVLVQNVVPAVTAELRETERKRKIEEAIVHRKRSSRIALRETEKEEARLAAQKRAEEDDKLARAKRLEARAKKEEAEREKRERAREQRRLEREERERKTRSRQEGKDSDDIDVVNTESAATLNGTSGSIQLSRVATPSGVRTPDWILDCEICRKSGINLDDGLPMVSCGVCSRWQHITCHDSADRNAGFPPRNWDTQQFCCQRCRTTTSRLPNGNSNSQRPPIPQGQRYSWSQSHDQKPLLAPAHQSTFTQPTPDMRYSQPPAYENGVPFGHQQQYPHSSLGPQPAAYPRSQRGQGLTFSHYQPDQRGFSRISHQSSPSSQPSWNSEYASLNGTHLRAQQNSQYAHQYSQSSGYRGSQGQPSFQPQIPSQSHPYNRGQEGQGANNGWARSPENYLPPVTTVNSVQVSAAESLAYLQQAGRHGWPNSSLAPGAQLGLVPHMQSDQRQQMDNGSYHFAS